MDVLDGGCWRFGDDSFPETGVTFFAGTFVRHPLALAAAKAVLCHLKEQGLQLQENLTAKTVKLVGRLNEILARSGISTRIETFGSWFYFTFPSDERFASLLYYFLRTKGIHLLEGFPCFLTTAHSDLDLERIVYAPSAIAWKKWSGGIYSRGLIRPKARWRWPNPLRNTLSSGR